MPVTLHQGEERGYIINSLSSEIDILYVKIKDMHHTDKVLSEGKELLKKYGQPFNDDSLNLRYIAHFIAIQAYENNKTLIEMLSSNSETDDIPLMKKGIGNMKEGCKLLIGFYIETEEGDKKDTLIKQSLLYPIHSKVQSDYPDMYQRTEAIIDNFRCKLESNNIKEIRDELTHYQKDKGKFNPFNFTTTALGLNCNEIYNLLFDYCMFLRLITQYVDCLMKLGYR